jgi:membrane-associated phospholipid phosphatase
LLPLVLVAVVYDSQRIYSDLIRGPIHVQEPYLFDLQFFGIEHAGKILTPNEWWQLHTHPALDFVTGFFYLTFISIYVLISLYLCLYLPRVGTEKRTKEWIKDRADRPMWAFFWVNVIGYSTYYWYAAAPPWYVAEHGLGPADLSVHASAAGAIRFDQLLGTHFFTEMYGRSADVFGAIPSLHVAYPLQSVFYAFQYGRLKTFAVFFYLIMCFSAVYLNHHYILDLIWGSAYALLVCFGLDYYFSRKPRP